MKGMNFILLILIGVLLYQSEDSRYFVSDQLKNASEFVRPEPSFKARF